MGERKRYVSYLDKPYKQREFCNGQAYCSQKCQYKFTKADKRKLAELKRQRVDYRNYPECEHWIKVEDFFLIKKMQSAVIKVEKL